MKQDEENMLNVQGRSASEGRGGGGNEVRRLAGADSTNCYTQVPSKVVKVVDHAKGDQEYKELRSADPARTELDAPQAQLLTS